MHQDLWTLEELIRKKQETVNRLDDELFQEIERQRVIEELMDGMSLTSSRQ
jgi:arsenate reductase-like glutaredoxin family protein